MIILLIFQNVGYIYKNIYYKITKSLIDLKKKRNKGILLAEGADPIALGVSPLLYSPPILFPPKFILFIFEPYFLK